VVNDRGGVSFSFGAFADVNLSAADKGGLRNPVRNGFGAGIVVQITAFEYAVRISILPEQFRYLSS
jgi:hypothetical protein